MNRFSALFTLLSLVISVFSATIIWVLLPKESIQPSFLLMDRGVWALTHVASSISLVAGILLFVSVNWSHLRKLLPTNSKKKENKIPQSAKT